MESSSVALNALKAELETYKQDNAQLKTKYETVARQLAVKADDFAVHNNDKELLLAEKDAQIEILKNEASNKDAKIATLTAQTSAMGQSAGAFTEQLQRQVSELQTKLAQSKVSLQSALKSKEEQSHTISQFESDLIELDNNLQEALQASQTKAATIKELNASLDKSTQEIATLTEELRESHAKIMDLQNAALIDKPSNDISLTSSAEIAGIAGYIEKIKEKDVQLAQLGSKLKAKEVELEALKTDALANVTQQQILESNLNEVTNKLDEMITSAVEAEEKISQLQTLVSNLTRLKKVVTEKDLQIEALQDAIQPPDEAHRNTRFQKKNEIIEQLNQSILAKEKTIQSLESQLTASAQTPSQPKLNALEAQLANLQRDLDSRKTMYKAAKKVNSELKNQFASAYEDGKLVANITDIDLRFKIEEAEHSKRVAESNLAKHEALNRQLTERCEKIERALVSAKKIDFVENKFTECLRLIEGQKKHNRGAYKQMCERVQKETEEKKVLQAKLLLLKSEYKKLTTPTDGPSSEDMKEEIEALKAELDLKNVKLNSVQTEFKALSHKFALLEAEFERG